MLPWSVLHLFVYNLGMSLAMPCLTLQALARFPEQRGLAASCQMFLQTIFNAAVAGVVAPALWDSTLTMAIGMGVLMITGAFLAWRHQRYAATHPL